MAYQIEIIEGHGCSSFWLCPVIPKEQGEIGQWEDVTRLEEEISIDEDDVWCFLYYFFAKYFDSDLTYNKRRRGDEGEPLSRFEWNLEHNFYTYGTLRKMLGEIQKTADLLECDWENPRLDEVKKNFSILYMCHPDHEDYLNRNESAVKTHISVVTDFYRRFVKRLSTMMDNNPDTNVLSVMGP